jgi:hypothetical protein
MTPVMSLFLRCLIALLLIVFLLSLTDDLVSRAATDTHFSDSLVAAGPSEFALHSSQASAP